MSADAQQRSPSKRIQMVLDGAHGRLDRDPFTFLVKGYGREVTVIWLRGHVYCDDRTKGANWLKNKVKSVLHAGGLSEIGEESWPSKYQGGRFR